LLPQGDYRKNLNTFMDAERAFSRMAAIQGIRASFLHFFAPDGIAFNPHAHIARDELLKQPEEQKPFNYLLAWEPRIADCSGRGDLGFTSGPLKLIDLSPAKKPIVHLAYFTIWRKNADGELKVVFDMGTPMATEPVFPKQMKVRGEPRPALVTMDMLDRAKAVIERFEEDIRKSTDEELPKTLELLFNKELIAYRPEAAPLQSEAEALAWHKANKLKLNSWEIVKTEVAGSADLLWLYGKYSGELNGTPTSGYWAHVWKSEIGKGWHIVADVMNVVPSKQ
jgi:ketosteroid isomerase-like protein